MLLAVKIKLFQKYSLNAISKSSEVLTAVVAVIIVSSYVMPCKFVIRYNRLEGKMYLYLHDSLLVWRTLHVVLYWCETLLLYSTDDHKVEVFENKDLVKEKFGSKRKGKREMEKTEL
jgi:hypothetical protein